MENKKSFIKLDLNTIIIVVLIFVLFSFNNRENPSQYNPTETKSITVIGSSEMEISPDEIILGIRLGQNWEHTSRTDYGFKYKLNRFNEAVEDVRNKLALLGVDTNKIKIVNTGSYWSYYHEEYNINKELEISIKDHKKIEFILSNLNTKYIDNIWIKEVKHSDQEYFRKMVKKDALKAARKKAMYLLTEIDDELGEVLKITEINNDVNNWWGPRYSMSNAAMWSPTDNSNNQFRTIKIRYEIQAEFAIN